MTSRLVELVRQAFPADQFRSYVDRPVDMRDRNASDVLIADYLISQIVNELATAEAQLLDQRLEHSRKFYGGTWPYGRDEWIALGRTEAGKAVQRRWWKETNYSRIAPSEALCDDVDRALKAPS